MAKEVLCKVPPVVGDLVELWAHGKPFLRAHVDTIEDSAFGALYHGVVTWTRSEGYAVGQVVWFYWTPGFEEPTRTLKVREVEDA